MEFALSEDQIMLQDSLKGMMAAASPLDDVRLVAAGDTGKASDMSAALAEMGTPGLLIAPDHGGLGMGALEAALVQEILGGLVSPASFMAGSAMAAAAISTGGSADQKTDWLPRIASGEVRFGVAVTENVGRRDGAGLTASAGTLSGAALFALEAETATHLLVADQSSGLNIVDASAARISPLTTIDKTRVYSEVTFDGAAAIALEDGSAALDRMIALGRILLAADSLGAMQTMLDKAVAYAGERKQFGRLIGSFQAVKHMCAEMAAKLEPCRALVWHAAYTFDTDPEKAALMACLAKSHINEVGTFVARTATEVHGGMGFTDLLGLHYWFKRIGVNRQLLGSPEMLRAEAAQLQGWV